jgi:hypothetical protein
MANGCEPRSAKAQTRHHDLIDELFKLTSPVSLSPRKSPIVEKHTTKLDRLGLFGIFETHALPFGAIFMVNK